LGKKKGGVLPSQRKGQKIDRNIGEISNKWESSGRVRLQTHKAQGSLMNNKQTVDEE